MLTFVVTIIGGLALGMAIDKFTTYGRDNKLYHNGYSHD